MKQLSLLLILIGFFSCDKSEIKKEYFSGGKLKRELRYNSKGELHGISVSFNQRGDTIVKAPYSNGQMDGTLMVYFDNGQLLRSVQYKNGFIDGLFLEYDQKGILRVKNSFKANKLEGYCYGYHENGNLQIKKQMRDSLLHGEYWSYYQDGITAYQRAQFFRGLKNGYYNTYFSNGKVKDSVIYVADSLIGFFSFDSLSNYIEGYVLPDSIRNRLQKKLIL